VKIKALAKHYFCRQKEEAAAILAARAPDFTDCDAKIQKALDKIDGKYPGGGPASGCKADSIHPRSMLLNLARRDASDMACRLRQEHLVERIERPGAIVFVDFYRSLNPVFSLRRPNNVPIAHARCFYASNIGSCTGSAEFVVAIPAQSEVTWPIGGAPGIPAVPASISDGHLVCVEIDDAGVAFSGNDIIASVTDDQRCAHDGVLLRGFYNSTAVFNGDLCLGSPVSADCPNGAEYEACPYNLDGSGTTLEPEIEGCWNTISSFTFHCQ
jgi:hypothetical protein